MNAWAGWAVEAMIASALLMAAVLLVRVAVRRAFGPGVAYALWVLPLLRLLLPPLPAWWQVATPVSRASATITYLVVDPAVDAPAAGSAMPSIGLMLGAVWLLGAVGFLGWHLVVHRRFCRQMLAGAVPIERRDGIRVIASPAASGPLAFGIVRRFIAFPIDIAERFDAGERELALAHELGHHRNGDLIANWAALLLLSLHWFNPLAWRAFHAFRADQELANDARVLAGRSVVDRHAYACAILKAAHGGTVSAACHLHTVKNLKGRLKMLTTLRTSRRRLATGAVSVALLTTAGLGLTASGTSAAAAINSGVKTSTGVDLQIPEPTVPPPPIATNVPPMPPAPASGKQAKRVVIVKDGKATTYDGAAAEAYVAAHPMPVPPAPPAPGAPPAYHVFVRSPDGALRPTTDRKLSSFVITPTEPMNFRDKDGKLIPTPEVVELNCPPSADSRNLVLRENKNGKERMIVCTNRIEKMSSDAAATAANAANVQKHAMETAMAGIETARASILAERNLTDVQRKEALAGLDEAIVEMRGEMAKAGKD